MGDYLRRHAAVIVGALAVLVALALIVLGTRTSPPVFEELPLCVGEPC